MKDFVDVIDEWLAEQRSPTKAELAKLALDSAQPKDVLDAIKQLQEPIAQDTLGTIRELGRRPPSRGTVGDVAAERGQQPIVKKS